MNWTHYVKGRHYLDSGMLRDLEKEEKPIEGNISLSAEESLGGITFIKGKKREYVRFETERKA